MIRTGPRSHLFPIAETGAQFVDFRPYVAAINDAGVIAFQATLAERPSCIFTCNSGAVQTAMTSPTAPIQGVYSHPDIDEDGALCFYGKDGGGIEAVYLLRSDKLCVIASTLPASVDGDGGHADLAQIGPLGPTMVGSAIAFRAHTRDGRQVVVTHRAGITKTNATSGERFTHFEGLPIVSKSASTIFRATQVDGIDGIYASDDRDAVTTIVDTSGQFTQLGRFPATDRFGATLFTAVRDNTFGVYRSSAGAIAPLCEDMTAFESVRGVIARTNGAGFWFAHPRGGPLGIYAGPHPSDDKIIAVGDRLMGSTIVEFALNPVSVNACDQLAVRLVLEDTRQLIVRLDVEPE